MKNRNTKQMLVITLIAVIISGTTAFTFPGATPKPFEGLLHFIQITGVDTLEWEYKVKGDFVRLESIKDKQITGVFIADLKNKKQLILNTSKKMYMEKTQKELEKKDPTKFEVTQSETKKTIQGQSCNQWSVKNKEENTIVEYWVSKKNYYFFEPLMRLLNRTEKSFLYFFQFKEINGVFPMQAVEYSLTKQVKSKLEVTKIEEKPMDDKFFKVPADYRKFDRQ